MSHSYIPVKLRQFATKQARYLCSYCQTAQKIVGADFTIDHIVPEALGGQTTADNLCLACWQCNLAKGDRITGLDPTTGQLERIFHPLQQRWSEHFQWVNDGLLIQGVTPTGRATVYALDLNRTPLVRSRTLWIAAGWHPPQV